MQTLREVRARRMLTIRKLAALAGVAPMTIHFIETGTRVPQFETMRKLATALGVEPMEIVEFAAAIEASAQGKEAA